MIILLCARILLERKLLRQWHAGRPPVSRTQSQACNTATSIRRLQCDPPSESSFMQQHIKVPRRCNSQSRTIGCLVRRPSLTAHVSPACTAAATARVAGSSSGFITPKMLSQATSLKATVPPHRTHRSPGTLPVTVPKMVRSRCYQQWSRDLLCFQWSASFKKISATRQTPLKPALCAAHQGSLCNQHLSLSRLQVFPPMDSWTHRSALN